MTLLESFKCGVALIASHVADWLQLSTNNMHLEHLVEKGLGLIMMLIIDDQGYHEMPPKFCQSRPLNRLRVSSRVEDANRRSCIACRYGKGKMRSCRCGLSQLFNERIEIVQTLNFHVCTCSAGAKGIP